MDPSANEWKPSASAATWSPGGGQTFSVPAPTSRPAAPTSRPVAPPAPAAPAPPAKEEDPDDDIDENDPLWMAVLKIANGDRAAAIKMISDPDSLTKYPEINEILMAGGGDDSMETDEVENKVEVRQGSSADENLAEEMDTKMKIDDKTSQANQKVEAVVDTSSMEEVEDVVAVKEGDPREHLNLVFIGHVDAGKSTLSGSILYILDYVDKRTIERYEKEAKERNRESWFLAFIMDTNEEERAKGKTVEVGKAHFETEAKRYTILDAPGHKNYVPNMIMGASQADVGVLVISARKGEFETGFDRGGQTREHAMLAKTLGVSYLVVVVNKMDDPTVNWSKDRFDECVKKLRPFLKGCGYTIKTEVKFIPVSGLVGSNVKDEVDSSVCPWWKNSWESGENNTSAPTLLSLFDSLEISGRDATAPLRIPILDRYTDRGTIAMGKVESGVIRPGMKVTLMPTRAEYKVDAVWANEDPVSAARPGENVLIKLAGAGTEDVRKGFVMCTSPACRSVDKIICQIFVVEMPENTRIMTAGFQAMFHAHCCEEECTILKIFETTNKGKTLKGARFAGVNMTAVCMIELAQTVPVETYDDYPFLGRFTLRSEGKTIAIGKIQKLPPKKS
ncbi:MAG: peptide chain release factor subunit 3 [Bacillariaceae sp.]|jgi:peptide chain release factor subunit 3